MKNITRGFYKNCGMRLFSSGLSEATKVVLPQIPKIMVRWNLLPCSWASRYQGFGANSISVGTIVKVLLRRKVIQRHDQNFSSSNCNCCPEDYYLILNSVQLPKSYLLFMSILSPWKSWPRQNSRQSSLWFLVLWEMIIIKPHTHL
jgi:hypothetical protein